MKRDTVNYVAVGGFVAAAMIGLAVLLFAITGRSGLMDNYTVQYRNVSGLKYGTPVYYQGYGIGQVDEITPVHNGGGTRYRVGISVQNGWPIPKDSIAAIMATGLLADVSIAIMEGQSAEILEPGSELRGQEGGDLFVALNEVANEIRSLAQNNIRPMIEQLTASLGAGGPILGDVQKLLAKLNEGADGLNQMVGPDNRRELAQILQQASRASTNAQLLTAQLLETRKQMDRLMAQANGLMDDTRPEAKLAVRELRASLQAISERIDTVMQQLDVTTRNMQEFSREIRANPNRLLSGSPPTDEVRP